MILNRPLQKSRSTDATNSSFPARAPTTTEPLGDAATATGASVIQVALPGGGGATPSHALIVPYGVGADTNVFNMRVYGIRRTGFGPVPNALFLPLILADLVCTMSTPAGVAGSPIGSSALFCDTITVTKEPTITADTTRAGTLIIFSPANDTIAWVLVPLYGAEKLELTFDDSTGNPTGMNAAVTFVDIP